MTPRAWRSATWRVVGLSALLTAVIAPATAAQISLPVMSAEPAPVSQVEELILAAVRLPLAAVLACGLALRPRRRGTPPHSMPVIQTQIILAVVGALVMLVVGASLARAFGIVGAAGLVRYRAKIDDPKDAGVMLSTLAIGLACGVGQWLLAVFGAVFVLLLLAVVESYEPTPRRLMTVTVKGKNVSEHKRRVEGLFRRQRVPFETRTVGAEELEYEVKWPAQRPVEQLSEGLGALDRSAQLQFEIDVKKDK
jgi:hypothetical protein